MPSERILALVPAGGSGSRMGIGEAKQYLPLGGRPMLLHTLEALLSVASIDHVALVVAVDDAAIDRLPLAVFGERLQVLRVGGATRAHSVRNGLRALATQCSSDDWVMVHDAARPCVSHGKLQQMISELRNDPVGGLLALPIADTVKRSDALQRVVATVPREALWRAQTPQMFRHGLLLQALEAAPEVTDEASAIEALGLSPRLVPGEAENLKITYPEDLTLAELILQSRKARDT